MEDKKQEYKVLKEFTTGPKEGRVIYEVGAIHDFEFQTPEEIEALIADGSIEAVPAEEKVDEEEEIDENEDEEEPAGIAAIVPVGSVPPAQPTLTYMGKKVISVKDRTVNDRAMVELLLEDHSTHDVSLQDYENLKAAAK